jgi:hypothetical protein
MKRFLGTILLSLLLCGSALAADEIEPGVKDQDGVILGYTPLHGGVVTTTTMKEGHCPKDGIIDTYWIYMDLPDGERINGCWEMFIDKSIHVVWEDGNVTKWYRQMLIPENGMTQWVTRKEPHA